MLYFGWVLHKFACVLPQNLKIDDWMTFPEIGLARTPEIENSVKYWMSFPEIGLCHAQNSKIDD